MSCASKCEQPLKRLGTVACLTLLRLVHHRACNGQQWHHRHQYIVKRELFTALIYPFAISFSVAFGPHQPWAFTWPRNVQPVRYSSERVVECRTSTSTSTVIIRSSFRFAQNIRFKVKYSWPVATIGFVAGSSWEIHRAWGWEGLGLNGCACCPCWATGHQENSCLQFVCSFTN